MQDEAGSDTAIVYNNPELLARLKSDANVKCWAMTQVHARSPLSLWAPQSLVRAVASSELSTTAWAARWVHTP